MMVGYVLMSKIVDVMQPINGKTLKIISPILNIIVIIGIHLHHLYQYHSLIANQYQNE